MSRISCFLERLAERQSTFVLFGDRPYGFTPSSSRAYPDQFEMGALVQYLVPSMSFREYEALDQRTQQAQIGRDTQEYVHHVVSKVIDMERSNGGEENRLKTLGAIMYEFLPFFVRQTQKDDRDLLVALGIEQETDDTNPLDRARAEINAYLVERFGAPSQKKKVEEEDPTDKIKTQIVEAERDKLRKERILRPWLYLEQMGLKEEQIASSRLGELTSHQPLYILDGKIFALNLHTSPVPEGMMQFKLGGKVYLPGEELFSLEHLTSELTNRERASYRFQAIERASEEYGRIAEARKSSGLVESHLIELSKLTEFDYKGSGFILKNGEYYLYATIPKFATQDGRNPERFWPYDDTRVAIKVKWEEGGIRSWDKPVVVERREFHPCLSDRSREGGFCGICNLSRDPSDYKNTLLDIVRKIGDAANTITTPLSPESLERHSGESYFGDTLTNILKQGSLTREQALEQGYRVVEVMETKVDKDGVEHKEEKAKEE
ncbi:MAG: hypothetical protein WCV90_01190 [Candidatus Woesearchaeota archaeon]